MGGGGWGGGGGENECFVFFVGGVVFFLLRLFGLYFFLISPVLSLAHTVVFCFVFKTTKLCKQVFNHCVSSTYPLSPSCTAPICLYKKLE